MIGEHHSGPFQDVYNEFNNNLFYIYIDGRYIETKYFKEAVQRLVFNICESNPTNKVGPMVHGFLKLPFFKEPEYRKGVCKQIRYQILPALWKNHKAIERKKQEKLTFLANEMDKAGRHVEAHVVRTIVKPNLKEMRKDWEEMTAMQKYVAAERKFFK